MPLSQVSLGGLNTVCDKIWGVPLKGYGYFVTLLNTLVYTAVYAAVALLRVARGDTRLRRQLRWARKERRPWIFVCIGGLDALMNILLSAPKRGGCWSVV